MSGPYKVETTMQYTSIVYYDADGWVVGEDRRDDDHEYDSGPHIPVSEEELEEHRD